MIHRLIKSKSYFCWYKNSKCFWMHEQSQIEQINYTVSTPDATLITSCAIYTAKHLNYIRNRVGNLFKWICFVNLLLLCGKLHSVWTISLILMGSIVFCHVTTKWTESVHLNESEIPTFHMRVIGRTNSPQWLNNAMKEIPFMNWFAEMNFGFSDTKYKGKRGPFRCVHFIISPVQILKLLTVLI